MQIVRVQQITLFLVFIWFHYTKEVDNCTLNEPKVKRSRHLHVTIKEKEKNQYNQNGKVTDQKT